MTRTSGVPRNFVAIQALRGVAALLVVVYHVLGSIFLRYPGEPSVLNGFFHLREFGVVGVDIFFVVSGFIMFHVYRTDFGKPGAAWHFMSRRLACIVPLYWVLTACMVLVLLLPSAFSTLRFDFRHAVESFLFLPTRNSAGEIYPVLNVGWTLTYEMYFYVLFACLLGTSPRVALLVIAVVFCGSVAAGYWLAPDTLTGAMLCDDILIEFALGGFIAQRIATGRGWSRRWATVAVLAAIVLFVIQIFAGPFHGGRLPGRGLPAFLLVAGLVSLKMERGVTVPQWLKRLGDESYSLYLSHIITVAVFFKLCDVLTATRWLSVDALIPAAVLVDVLGAHPGYALLERPMLRGTTRALQKRRRLANAGPAA